MTPQRTILRFGFWFAAIAFVASAGFCIVQTLQVLGVLGWPWADILISATSFCIAWPFLLAMLALHRVTPAARNIWSGAGLMFALLYAGYVGLIYVLQLATAVPLNLRGTPNPVFATDRYSLYWTSDAMGYICMGISTLLASRAFPATQPWVRRFFVANGVFTPVVALVYFYPVFSAGLLLCAAPWMITAPGSLLLLALWFRKMDKTA